MEINTLLFFGVPMIALIIGLVQVIKTTFKSIKPRFMPLMSVSLGLVMGIILTCFSKNPGDIVMGVACGLSSCGLFDVGKKLKE